MSSFKPVIPRFLLLAIGTSVAAVPVANAFVTLGHGRLIGTTVARADYDSNVYVSNRQVDDLVGTLTGEVRYVRDSGVVTFDSGIGATALAFVDHSELNSFDPFFDARVAYSPSDKTDLRAVVSARRNSMGNESVNARTESNDYSVDGYIQHLTTEKLGFRINSAYTLNNYLTPGYSDTERFTIGGDGLYVYSPKLKLLSGIAMSDSWSDSAVVGRSSVSGRDWRYTVGAEGEFAPKLTGFTNVGYQQRQFDSPGFDDTGSMYISSRLMWTANEKTNYSVSVLRDFGVTAADQSSRSLTTSLAVNHQISQKVTFEGSVGADWADYDGAFGIGSRKDRGYSIRGRLNYSLRDNAQLDLSMGYRDNDSTVAFSDYDRFTVGVGLSLRF